MKISVTTLCTGFLVCGSGLFAQLNPYSGANVTGQLTYTGSVSLLQLAQQASVSSTSLKAASVGKTVNNFPHIPPTALHPAYVSKLTSQAVTAQDSTALAVTNATGVFGFNGLTHLDQLNSNSWNQFSVEPAMPSVAVGNGYILEGVQDAVQVYSTAGKPLLPQAVSTNQLFNVPAAVNRNTGIYGVFLTDMRVFFDPGINRWLVVEWAQANDPFFDNPLPNSTEYIAVSHTANPTAGWDIYSMDTTDWANPACPCIPDYPLIGADQYGIYISSNEFNSITSNYVDATILAISKHDLQAVASKPTAYEFTLQPISGYEFAIQPATTPPGASYFVANNGLEYLASSYFVSSAGSGLAVWALTNTGSLATRTPSPSILQVVVPTLTYLKPPTAPEPNGPTPYGSTLFPPGLVAGLDGGDCRIQSLSYSGGRLYATLATQVTDDNDNIQVGGAYFILSPAFRGGALSIFSLRQGYVMVNGENLLRSAIAVNPSGQGAIAFTLVGNDYYPSAAFLPIDTLSTGSSVEIAANGAGPEDGFTGYPDIGFSVRGIARWGDISSIVAASDGSIWMASEYIPNLPRSQYANWGTYVVQYKP